MYNRVKLEPLAFLKWVVMSLVGVLMWQTFNIQVLNSEVYQTKTKDRVTSTRNVYAGRGRIMDRNGIVFADNYRDTTKGVDDYSRIFLQGHLASQIVGKLDFNGRGNMGMEKVFDTTLSGIEGIRVGVRDVQKREIYSRSEEVAKAEPGLNLVLTIDRNMQEIVEKALKDGVEEFQAASASAVVIEPVTGEILAMASYPTFDPNSRTQGVGRMAKNDIVSLPYEPGSTFKVITAAAALEDGIVSPDKVYPSNGGRCWEWWEGNPKFKNEKPICDSHVIGEVDMPEAMAQSSNVYFARVADAVGADRFYRMARSFGIGIQTSEYFQGEESGRLLKPFELERDARTLMTMGYGHAVMVTPIQMAMAYAAIANGGVLMEPMIVKEWRDWQGNVVDKKKPTAVRRVISEKTAASIRKMLQRVVYDKKGTAKQAMSKKIPNVIFGGKTGTAEKYNHVTRKYDKNRQVASLIGLAPIEDVRYVCMVLVDDPNMDKDRGHTGGVTAGPIFRRIMEGIYFHPQLSPISYNLAQVKRDSPCDVDFMGMPLDGAKKVASDRNCKVAFDGVGSRVISQRQNTSDTAGVTLVLGEMAASKMPDLKGLSLRDAMEIMGNIRVNVEYEGKGHVVAQSPMPEEELRKGTICKLKLKERG